MNRKVNVQLTRRVGIEVEDRNTQKRKLGLFQYCFIIIVHCSSQTACHKHSSQNEEQY